MKLYIDDFINLTKALDQLENELKLKDQNITDLHYTVKKLEDEIQNSMVQENIIDIKYDLEKTVKIIHKLCEKRPDILAKIRVEIVFKTIKI